MTILSPRAEESFQAVPHRPQKKSWDVVTVLSIYAVLRIVLPSQYVIGPLGGAGQPAQLLGLGMALWWLTDWLGRPWSRSRVKQPLKRVAFILLLAVLASYLVAAVRPLSSIEQLAADRAVLNITAWIGVMVAALDGITTRARLDTLLRRVVLLGALEGVFGVVQVLAKQSFVQYLQLPGLSNTGVDPLLLSRGSFLRPVGTAISPIEYGVFLSMVLPVALYYAMSDAGRRSFIARWLPVGAIACALSLSLSRSAIISTVVGLAVLLPAWPPRIRRRVYATAVVFVGIAAFVLRGFFKTILTLFTGIGSDSSTLSRADSYALSWSFITRDPLFGRGMGTFLPEYWILDNQYLGSLIEIGIVGLSCMLLLFLVGAATGWRLKSSLPIPEARDAGLSRLGPALAAAIAAGCVSFAFFDAFSFPLVPSTLFVMFGCVGALQRLAVEDAAKYAGGVPAEAASVRPPQSLGRRRVSGTTIWSLAGTVRRLWPLALVGLAATCAGFYFVVTIPGVFTEQEDVIFVAPNGSGLQQGSSSLVSAAGLIESQMHEQGPLPLSPAATIVGTGIRDGVWVRLPNNGGQWATNFDQEDLDVEIVGSNPRQVQAEMQATVTKIRTLLRQDQLSAGARPGQLIGIGVSPPSPPVFYAHGSTARAGLSALVLGLVLTLATMVMIDRWLMKRAWNASDRQQQLT